MKNLESLFWRRRIFQLAFVTSGLFLLLTTVAMFLYPGGAPSNPDAPGYDFFRNFFSDLGLTQAHNGQSNLPAAALFVIALTSAGVGLIFFFIAFRQFFGHTWPGWLLSRPGSLAGIIAGVCFIGVAFTPANLWREAHIQFVYYAFQSFLVAAVCYTGAILYERRYPWQLALVFAVFTLLLAMYVYLLFYGPSPHTPAGRIIQVTGQKIIAYAAIVSIMIQSAGVLRLPENQPVKL